MHEALIFFGGTVAGCLGGMMLMALMVASRDDDRRRDNIGED